MFEVVVGESSEFSSLLTVTGDVGTAIYERATAYTSVCVCVRSGQCQHAGPLPGSLANYTRALKAT